MLDSTDVNLWYKIGHVALRLIRLPLARHAFEEGLRCNPDHWPCLDNLITVLYTLSDYTSESGQMREVDLGKLVAKFISSAKLRKNGDVFTYLLNSVFLSSLTRCL